MNDAAIGVQHRFMHGFGDGRVREDGMHQFLLGGFQRPRHGITLNHFRNFRADHMRAQKLAGLGVEDGFDETFRLTQRNRLAIANERETPDLDLTPGSLGFRFGHADAGDLRRAIGAARNIPGSERMHALHARDFLNDDHSFMAGLVREPWRPRDIADGINARLTGFAPLVDGDMALVDFRLGVFQAEIFGVAGNADGHNHAIECRWR